jgi:hypothetical protein
MDRVKAARIASPVLVAVALLIAGYGLGRFHGPAMREQMIVTDTREEVRWRSRVEVVSASQTDVRTRKVTRWLPSGEVRHVEELVDRSTDVLVAREDRAREEVRTEVKIERVIERVPAPLPDWTAAAMVGRHDGETVAGGMVARRIVGPLSLGAWGTSSMRGDWAAGLALQIQF